MKLTPEMIRLMSPEDRAKYDPMNLAVPVVADPRKQTDYEKDLQRLCELELSRRGIWYLHLSCRAREKAGTPDLLFVVADGDKTLCGCGYSHAHAQPWAIELKSATGVLSEDQKKTLEMMSKNGWRTGVCRTFEEFRELVFGDDNVVKENASNANGSEASRK